eukprot:3023040-Amphidinium_carterae.1
MQQVPSGSMNADLLAERDSTEKQLTIRLDNDRTERTRITQRRLTKLYGRMEEASEWRQTEESTDKAVGVFRGEGQGGSETN